MYRHSHRMVVSALSDLFGVKMSLGTVNRMRKEASEAVSAPVEEAKAYVQSAPIVGADETGFGQGNGDGQNPHSKRAWLWVAVTPLVSFFCVALSRSTAAAQSLLGENFRGFLNSDRYNAYNWVDVDQRQLCWAHLKREFTKISERSGVSRQLGRDLLAQEKKSRSSLAARARWHSESLRVSVIGVADSSAGGKLTHSRGELSNRFAGEDSFGQNCSYLSATVEIRVRPVAIRNGGRVRADQ